MSDWLRYRTYDPFGTKAGPKERHRISPTVSAWSSLSVTGCPFEEPRKLCGYFSFLPPPANCSGEFLLYMSMTEKKNLPNGTTAYIEDTYTKASVDTHSAFSNYSWKRCKTLCRLVISIEKKMLGAMSAVNSNGQKSEWTPFPWFARSSMTYGQNTYV